MFTNNVEVVIPFITVPAGLKMCISKWGKILKLYRNAVYSYWTTSIGGKSRIPCGRVARRWALGLHASRPGEEMPIMYFANVSPSLLKLKACLHVPSTFACPSPSPSKFIIVSMETDRLMDRMGSVPILPVKWTITIGIMLYFDGDGDRHGDGDGTCKQALKL